MSETLKERLENQRKSEESLLTQEKRKLWMSAQDLEENWELTKARRSQEFAASQKDGEAPLNLSRRRFLQWASAASVFMSTAACKRRPADTLVPYVHKPQGFVAGVPVWYASSAANGYGILVKTREGRPIKVEGNPDHPVNQGGLDASTQACLLDLYNPERLRGPLKSGTSTTWKIADAELVDLIKNAKPGAVRLLTGRVLSPSASEAIKAFCAAFKAKHHAMPSLDSAPVASAYESLLKQPLVPAYQFDKADVILSVDADFLGSDPALVENTKEFSKRRRIHRGNTNVNRLFVFESQFSVTGLSADHRIGISPSAQLAVVLGITRLVAQKASNSNLMKAYDAVVEEANLTALGLKLEDLRMAADALWSARGKSLVLAGGRGPDAKNLQLAVIQLNQILQNYGTTLDTKVPAITGFEAAESYEALLADMAAGQVEVLITQGVNPAYQQVATEFTNALSKVKTLVSISRELNETASLAKYVLPESHFLEAWGDAQVRSGVVSIQQPVIEPLFDTRSLGEIVLNWTRGSLDYRSFVQEVWKKNFFSGSSFDLWWQDQLRKGSTSVSVKARGSEMRGSVSVAWTPRKADELEVVLYQSANIRDGSQTGNAWLIELPDPISKATWSNYVALSPELAKKYGFREDLQMGQHANDVARVTVNGKSLELPVHIQPGLRPNVLAIALGWGRSKAGSVGTDAGRDAWILAARDAQGSVLTQGLKAQLAKTGATYALATTQRHYDLQGRDHDILQQTTLAEFLKNPKAAKEGHGEELISLYKDNEFVYPDHKWGMAIDLNSCTGCSACIVACYSENNIGIVGEDQVRKGRHLAWLRMDVYYGGEASQPDASVEPMLCQQCTMAPCETVCPVLATVHSSDGLNDMSYNRCVGTRYCANNCPYKVRRFNYFQYSDSLGGKLDVADPLPMGLNPDVTVRSRGVMEKCTFCVQRIRRGVDEFKQKKEKLVDGAIKTACQQSCPADAIVFGDLNDPESEVSKISKLAQGFKVLEVLNTRPSITYLPRIRNKGNA